MEEGVTAQQDKPKRKPLTEQQKLERREYLVGYRAKNKDKIRVQQKAWYDLNIERILLERKEHYEENKEEVLAQNAEYRENNKDKIKAQKKEYREQNKEQIAAKKKADYWVDPERARELKRISYHANKEKNRLNRKAKYWANREQILAERRERRKKNADEVNEKQRAARARNPQAHYEANKRWEEKNPEKVKAYKKASKQNRRLAESLHKLTSQDILNVYAECEGRCMYCIKDIGNETWHVEHMRPLARGGLNTPENITVSCPPCNLRKSTKTVKEFVFGWRKGTEK